MVDFVIAPSQVNGEIWIPPSKSQTLRAILFALAAKGRTTIKNPLHSPDTDRALAICRLLGAAVGQADNVITIDGVGRDFHPVNEPLDVGNSGILRRFLTALLATTKHRYKIVGDASVMSRPMAPLYDALAEVGVHFFDDGSFQGSIVHKKTHVIGTDSQHVSALLIAASMLTDETIIHVDNPGELPWVDLTLSWLDRLGVSFKRDGYTSYQVRGRILEGFNYTVPGDYSTAAFPYAAGLITKGKVIMHGLDNNEIQGDKLLFEMDLMKGGVFDINRCVDALPIAAVMGCYASASVLLTNGWVARTKECDRISIMATELRKMGAEITEREDGLAIIPSALHGAELHSHEDHRVALALVVAALGAKSESTLLSCSCIEKTFPAFVETFQQLGGEVSRRLLTLSCSSSGDSSFACSTR